MNWSHIQSQWDNSLQAFCIIGEMQMFAVNYKDALAPFRFTADNIAAQFQIHLLIENN